MADLPHVPGVEHDMVQAGEVRLHVATAGPPGGEPVVLLHGWPQHWWMWRHQLTGLAQAGHRVVAPDLRGHGWSDVPAGGYDREHFAGDVLALLDALGIDRFSVAGHDWGGWTAQLLALRAPERVRRMALLSIVPVSGQLRRTLPHAWRAAYQLPLATPVVGPTIQRRFLSPFFTGLDRAMREVYEAPFREPARAAAGSLVYRDFLRRDLRWSATGRYDGLRLPSPLLVISGSRDPVVRPSLVEGFRDHADEVRLERFERIGHFVVDQRPEQVTRLLLDHLS